MKNLTFIAAFVFFFFALCDSNAQTTSALAGKYQNHYTSLTQKMGYQIKPDEMEINYFGYEALKSKYYFK